jgi:lipoate-protein ligase A
VKYCDLTFATSEENLACDEALLDLCEDGLANELLRFWEPASYFVVVGYGNKVATEVNLPFCQANGIPVLRRCTGGGTVLQGSGLLNYSLILRTGQSSPLQSISGTNDFILQRHQAVLSALLKQPVEVAGQTDLAIGGLKFSGNSQRRKKQSLLFHGSFLLDLDISLVERTLPLPSKRPCYRRDRSHSDFLINLRIPVATLKTALLEAWQADHALPNFPTTQITTLARDKYGQHKWNFKF